VQRISTQTWSIQSNYHQSSAN